MRTELQQYLEKTRYILTHSEIRNGVVRTLRNQGLEILTVCYAGKGRSPLVAELLERDQIPAIALQGGVKFLGESSDTQDLVDAINAFQMITVILDWGERREFSSQLSRLNIYRTFDSEEIALKTLRGYN